MRNMFEKTQQRLKKNNRKWLRNNPKSLRLLRRFNCFDNGLLAIARGISIGLFFGLTPTVGFQTLLVLPCCLLFRANFPLAFAATWVSNPLTMGPLYYSWNRIGNWLLAETAETSGSDSTLSFLLAESEQLVIGSLIFAIPACIISYWVVVIVFRNRAR